METPAPPSFASDDDHLVRLHCEEWFGGDKGLLQTAPTRTAGTTSGVRGRGG